MSAHNDVIKQLREAIICNFDLAAISTVEAKNTINEAKTLIDHVELLRDQQGQLEGWKYFLHLRNNNFPNRILFLHLLIMTFCVLSCYYYLTILIT